MADDISQELAEQRKALEFKEIESLLFGLSDKRQQQRGTDITASAASAGAVPSAADPEKEESGVGGAAVAGDIAMGAVESTFAITRGVIRAVEETSAAIEDVGDWLENTLPSAGIIIDDKGMRFGTTEDFRELNKAKGGQSTLTLPKPSEPTSTTGKIIEGFSQFLTGFIGAGKFSPVKPITAGGKFAETTGRSAAASFTALDPHEERLSNLIEKVPSLRNPVTQFLAASPADTVMEGRVKNVLEDLALAPPLIEGTLRALRTIREGRIKKAEARDSKGLTAEERELFQQKVDLSLLGDPDEDILKTTAISKQKKNVKGTSPKDVLEGDTPGKVEINFARIEAPEDIDNVIQRMADARAGDIEKAQRGVRTWKQTKLSARQTDAWKALTSGNKTLTAEQTVAARELWVSSAEKLTAISRAARDNPSEGNLVAFRKMMATHYAIQQKVLGVRTETARALNAWAIPAGSEASRLRQIKDLLDENGGAKLTRDMAKRVAALAEGEYHEQLEGFVKGSVFARTERALMQIWINALLSNPATHVVNASSNLGTVVHQIAERAFARQVSIAMGGTDGVAAGESIAMMYGAIEGFKDAMVAFGKTRGKSLLSESADESLKRRTKIDLPSEGALTAEALGVPDEMVGLPIGKAFNALDLLTRTPGRLLQASDEVFKSIGYRMELQAQVVRRISKEIQDGTLTETGVAARKRELLENPSEDMRLAAVDQALYQTFTQKPAAAAKQWGDAVQNTPFGRLIMPFKNTPINLMTYTFERTPFAPLLVKQFREEIAAGGARADIAIARMTTGTMVLMAAIDLGLNGVITGSGPSRPAEKALFRRTSQPYSAKAGGFQAQFNRMDPLGMTLGLGADIADLIVNYRGDEKTIEELIVGSAFAIAQNVTSKTYMKGISDFMSAINDPDRYGQPWWEGLAGTAIPAGVANIARQVDPYMREASGAVEAIQRRTPYHSADLPAYRDLWGRKVDWRSGFGMAYDVVSPFYIKRDDPEPIDVELKRIGFFPSSLDQKRSYRGIEIDFSRHPHAFERLVSLAGNDFDHPVFGMGAKDFLNSVIEGDSPYSNLYHNYLSDGPDGTKAKFIRGVIDNYRKWAIQEIVTSEEFPEIRAEYEDAREEKTEAARLLLMQQE